MKNEVCKEKYALVNKCMHWWKRPLAGSLACSFTHSHTHYCTPLLVQQVFYSKSVGGILASQSNQALKSPDRWLILSVRSLARSAVHSPLSRPPSKFETSYCWKFCSRHRPIWLGRLACAVCYIVLGSSAAEAINFVRDGLISKAKRWWVKSPDSSLYTRTILFNEATIIRLERDAYYPSCIWPQ